MPAVRTHNWKRIAGTAVAALFGLLVVACVVVAVQADARINDYLDELAAEWTTKLGRPVRVGEVDVSLFSGRIEVAGLEIGAGEDEPRAAPKALTIERASLDIGMLQTLSSAGTHPRVQSMTLAGLQVNVVRLPDGTLNWQRLADRFARMQEPEAKQGPDERVQNTVVDAGRLENAEIAFIDLAREASGPRAPRQARISALNVQIQNAGYERGMTMALSAAVLANEQNLDLHVRTSGVREREGKAAPPAIHELDLDMAPTELAPLAPFLAALSEQAGSSLEQGVLSADFAVDREGSKATAKGNVALASARMGRGQPFDAELTLDVVTDSGAGRADVKQAVLKAGDMSLVARGVVSGLNDIPRVQDLTVRSEGLSFDRIRALYPAFVRRLAPAELAGPFLVSSTGSGTREAQHVELELNMTAASVIVPERFRKPSGTPLVLRAALDAGQDVADISELALQLADFRMVGRGQVRDLRSDAPRFQVRFETPSPRVGSLLRLLPEVARAIGERRNVPGELTITGNAQGTRTQYTAEAKLALAGLDVRANDARFAGGGQATFTMRRQAQRWSATARADFTQLRAVYPGMIRKPEATPFTFEAKLRGVPGRPQAFEAEVPSFAFAAGRSDIRGSLRLANMQNPRITARARARYLDLNDFLPGRDPAAAKKSGPRPNDSALAKADGTITLRIDAGKASGVDYEDLDAELRLHDGRAKAETLRVSAFGGRLSGSGSELPLFASSGPVRVRGALEGMQAAGLLAHFAGASELLRGTLGGTVDVTSSGATLEDVRNSLTGRLSGSVDGAEFVPGSAYAALADRLQSLATIPALQQTLEGATERIPEKGGWRLSKLAGMLRFDDGSVFVQEPLTAQTPQGELSLNGRVSLSGSGKLTGTWSLQPSAIESLIGTELDLKQPIPIELRIEGPLTQPRFAFGDVKPVLEPLVRAYAGKQLEGAARKGLDEALDETGLRDKLPFGTKREGRGAKQQDEGDAAKQPEQKKQQRESTEDKAKREIERRLPDLF